MRTTSLGSASTAGEGPHVSARWPRSCGSGPPPRSCPTCRPRFAARVSYGLSAVLLGEILPLGRALHATTVRRQVQATAQRLEDELGNERPGFITGCPADWAELPRPYLPLVVGLRRRR